MFRSLSVKNFRCFQRFKIEGLERVNLIGGANDVGKTCLLEAIFVLSGESNAFLLQRLNHHRGLQQSVWEDSDETASWLWDAYFHEYRVDQTIEIEGVVGSRAQRRLRLKVLPSAAAAIPLEGRQNGASESTNGHASKTLQAEYSTSSSKHRRVAHLTVRRKEISVQPPPAAPEASSWFLAARGAAPVDEDAKLLDRLEVVKKGHDLVAPLRILEPRLKALRTISGAGGTLIFGDIGLARLVPLGILGDGVNRFMTILLRIASAAKGVVLIDEIENGIHYAKLEPVWQAIANAAALFDVQVFATTHSFECIRAAHQAFKAHEHYGFRYFRLENQDGDIVAIDLDEERLDAILHSDLEIR